MKMGRVGDPTSQTLVHVLVDGDRVWGIWLVLYRRHDISIDPVMYDREADPIPLANLTHVQGSLRRSWGSNAVFVAQPFYRGRRDRFSG